MKNYKKIFNIKKNTIFFYNILIIICLIIIFIVFFIRIIHVPFYINDGVLHKYNMYNNRTFLNIKSLFFNYNNNEIKENYEKKNIIPILIISYNNHKYVANTIRQIININASLENSITIIDNNSDNNDTIQYLKDIVNIYNGIKIIYNKTNSGPWVTDSNNVDIYNSMPDKFILTDPDLEFNSNLPTNFIDILVELSNTYNCKKIGFALKIDDSDKMYKGIYFKGKNIYDWESQFWVKRIDNPDYELYSADIDTTFYLHNKNGNDSCIRIAGNFTARHLPFYINDGVLTITDKYNMYNNSNKFSTMKSLFFDHYNNEIKEHYENRRIYNNSI